MPPRAPAGGAGAPPAAAAAAVVEPEELLCPVTRVLLRDPVVTSAGNTYERAALLASWAHRARGTPRRDPLTNEALASREVYPNWFVRNMVSRPEAVLLLLAAPRGPDEPDAQVATFLASHPGYTPEGWEDRVVPPPAQTEPAEDSGLVNAAEASFSSSAEDEEHLEALMHEYMGHVGRDLEDAYVHIAYMEMYGEDDGFGEEEEGEEEEDDEEEWDEDEDTESEYEYVNEDFPTESQLSARRRLREANRWVAGRRFEERAMHDEEEELVDEELREYCREDWDREHCVSGGSDTSSVLNANRSRLPDSSASTGMRSRSPRPPRGCRPTLVAAVRKMEVRRRAAAAAAKCDSSSSEETPPRRRTMHAFQDCTTDRSGSSSASCEESVLLDLPWNEAVSAWRGRSAAVHHRVRMPTPEPPDDSGLDEMAVAAPLTDAEVEELMQLRARMVADILVHRFGNDPGKLLADAEHECGARGPLVSYEDL